MRIASKIVGNNVGNSLDNDNGIWYNRIYKFIVLLQFQTCFRKGGDVMGMGIHPKYLGVKYHQCCKDGHTYWIMHNVLMACPTNANGTIDEESYGSVEDFELNPEDIVNVRNHVLSELIE